jgi:hypothetical protein
MYLLLLLLFLGSTYLFVSSDEVQMNMSLDGWMDGFFLKLKFICVLAIEIAYFSFNDECE